MNLVIVRFKTAYKAGSGSDLANTISPPTLASSADLYSLYNVSEKEHVRSTIERLLKDSRTGQLDMERSELVAWADVYVAYWEFLDVWFATQAGQNVRKQLYESWKEVTNILLKSYSSNLFESWTLPCLYMAGRWLRTFAIAADQETHNPSRETLAVNSIETDDISSTFTKCDALEDAARVLNRMFTLCITDRAATISSRKWALYYITNLLFKTYFKLNTVSLCKNPWRALQASHVDMPPLDAFPKSHICTFKYYVGLMFFLEEDYRTAETNLNDAYQLCHSKAHRNLELILTYLIPCRLMTTRQLPKHQALAQYPRLQQLLSPISGAIRSGNLAAFDAALATGEDSFIKARIYLTLERGRDICLRNLFRRVFRAGGFEDGKGAEGTERVRRSRIPVEEFVIAVQASMGAQDRLVDREEVECLMANAIHKGLMKGYIARERGVVVLSKGAAFPGTE